MFITCNPQLFPAEDNAAATVAQKHLRIHSMVQTVAQKHSFNGANKVRVAVEKSPLMEALLLLAQKPSN